MDSILLKAEEMNKSFGATKAVVNFSMEIKAGEIHGLIGENGSGKSTFSSMVAGILKPDSGKMTFKGQDYSPTSSSEAANLGSALIVQEIGTIGSITAADNIFLNQERRFVKKALLISAK